MANKCPFCGAPLNWREVLAQQKKREGPAWGPWERRVFSPFGLADVAALPAGAQYERRRPVRDPTVESDVLTPGLQTLISGVVGGMVSAAVAVTVGWARPWAYGLAGSAGVLALAWTALLADHRALLWEVERVTGADIDGDGVTGEPVRVDVEPEPRVTRVEVTERRPGGRMRMWFANMPLGDDDLEAVARAVLVRKERFSRSGLSDVLSQGDYADLYQAMLDARLLTTTGNRNELTAAGRAFLGQYLDGWRERQQEFMGYR